MSESNISPRSSFLSDSSLFPVSRSKGEKALLGDALLKKMAVYSKKISNREEDCTLSFETILWLISLFTGFVAGGAKHKFTQKLFQVDRSLSELHAVAWMQCVCIGARSYS